jgi:hypothetical protein
MGPEVVVPDMPNQTQQLEPVTQDNMLEHPDTPAPMLHEWIKNADFSDGDESSEKLMAAVKHPNISTDALNHLYQQVKPQQMTAEPKRVKFKRDHHENLLQEALKHPNFSARDAEDLIATLHGKEGRWGESLGDIVASAAKIPGVDRKVLQELTERGIEDNQLKRQDFQTDHAQNLDPSYLLGLLRGAGHWQPVTENMTEAQKRFNNRAGKIYDVVQRGLASTNLHTPENTAQVIAALHDRVPGGITPSEHHQFFTNYVQNNPHLTHDQLEKLFVGSKPEDEVGHNQHDLRTAILGHRNVDPGFLARVATAAKTDPMVRQSGQHHYRSFDDLRAEAIKHPSFPEQTKNKLVTAASSPDSKLSEDVIDALIESPTVTADDRRKMFAGGVRKVLNSKQAPQDLIEQEFARKRDDYLKSTNDARDFLSMPNTPASVLQQLVNHKNLNVASDALQHGNVDRSVVDAALARKAKQVNEAAAKHPLAPADKVLENVLSGKTSAHDLLFGSKEKKRRSWQRQEEKPQFNMSDDVAHKLHERYRGFDDERIISTEGKGDSAFNKFLKVKHFLATNQEVPGSVRAEAAKDLADKYQQISHGEDLGMATGHTGNLDNVVHNLADSGNVDAQEAVLKTGNVHRLKLESPTYTSSFIDRAAQVLDGPDEHDEHGSIAHKIMSNPNSSDEAFEKAALNQGLQKDHNNYDDLVDKRMEGKSDEYVGQFFSKLMAQGTSGAHELVARSASAPLETWEKAWRALPGSAKDEVVGQFTELMNSPEMKNRALSGMYDFRLSEDDRETAGYRRYDDVRDPRRVLHRRALASLSPEDPEDMVAVDTMVRHQAQLPDDDEGRLTGKDVVDSLQDGFFEPAVVPTMNQKFFGGDERTAREFGVPYAMKVASDQAGSIGRDAPNAIQQREQVAKQFIETISTSPGGFENPMAQQNAIAQRWLDVMDDVDFLKKFKNLRNLKLFDGLANLQAAPELATKVKDVALQHGLLSDEVSGNLSIEDPTEFGSIMRSASGSDKAGVMQNTMAVGSVHPDVVKLAAAYMSAKNLLPVDRLRSFGRHGANRTQTPPEERAEQLQHAKGVMDNFMRHALVHDDSKAVGTAISNLLKDSDGPAQGGFYKDEMQDLVNHAVSRLMPEQAADPRRAVRSLLSIYNQVNESDRDKLPKQLVSTLVGNAVQQNDVGQLVEMSKQGIADKRIYQAIKNNLANPTAMTDENLVDVQSMSRDMDPKTFRAVMDESIHRGASNPTLKAATVQNLGTSTRSVGGASSKEDLAAHKQNDYIVTNLLAYQDDPVVGGAAVGHLLYQIGPAATVSVEQSQRIFAAISRPDAEVSGMLDGGRVRSELANDPKTIEAAQDGWRLEALSKAVDKFNPDTATVVTNRVMNATQMSREAKGWYAAQLIQHDGMKAEDVTKMARSVGPDAIPETMKEISSQAGEDAPETSLHHLVDPAVADLQEWVEGRKGISAGGQMYDTDHCAAILGRVSPLVDVVRRYARANNYSNAREKNEKIDMMTDRCLGAVSKVLDEAAKHGQTSPVETKTVVRVAGETLKQLFSKKGEAGRVYTEDQSKAILDAFSKTKSFGGLPATDASGGPVSPETQAAILAGWVRQGRTSDESWPEIHAQHPEMAVALSNAKDYPVAAVASIDMDRLMESDLPRDHNIGEVLDSVLENAAPYGRSEQYPRLLKNALERAQKGKSVLDYGHALTIARHTIRSAPNGVSAEQLMALEHGTSRNDMMNSKIVQDAMIAGAGGKEYLDHVMRSANVTVLEGEPDQRQALLESAATSPHLDEKHANALIDAHLASHGSMKRGTILDKLCSNQMAPKSALERLYSLHEKGEVAIFGAALNKLAANGNVPREVFDKTAVALDLHDASVTKRQLDNPCLRNGSFGIDAFMSLPDARDVPEKFHLNQQQGAAGGAAPGRVDKNKLIDSARYSASHARLRQVLTKIPAEGTSWVDFKRANKQMESWPETRKLFEGKMGPADRVTPEDVERTMRAYPSNAFGVTYTDWTGAQRHMESSNDDNFNNLVMQLNTSDELHHEMAKDPKLFQFFQFVQESANYSSHPVNPHCVGWTRLDVSGGKEGWVVEEFQSDFSSRLRQDVEKITVDVQKRLREEAGIHLTPEEIIDYTGKIEKIVSGWYHAALHGIEDLARKQGVKNLYIHGQHVRAKLSGMNTDRSYPVKLTEMYHKEPPKFGYKECQYTDYPNWSKSMVEDMKSLSQDPKKNALQCWRKRL